MSVSRRFVVVATAAVATVAPAISFTGAASGASVPSVPSATVIVHADPGHVSTRLVGTTCGGYITVLAIGRGGGTGKAACGRSSLTVAASADGSFDSTYAPLVAGTFVCQANALFASHGVDVICSENVD